MDPTGQENIARNINTWARQPSVFFKQIDKIFGLFGKGELYKVDFEQWLFFLLKITMISSEN